MKIFGYEIKRIADMLPPLPAPSTPSNEDGAVNVVGGGSYGTYVDLDGTVRSDAELITKYRAMAEHPDVDIAIDNIINDMIVKNETEETVNIDLDEVKEIGPDVKALIEKEFQEVLRLLEFNTQSYEIAKRWYVDGRLNYFNVIDPQAPEQGIQELRYMDPRKIRKVREIEKKRDPETGIIVTGKITEYYMFNDKGFQNSPGAGNPVTSGAPGQTSGVRLAKDSVTMVSSGLTSAKGDMVLSYLHKAIKPLNNLRSLEDSLIIYRLSRAPERRIFYVDVGNLPRIKAEQYLADTMAKFKNKLVYDAATGEVRDDRKFMSMLEDFWLPRRENGRGTEITTLPSGQNLGQIEDIVYFQKKLFGALNVPASRLDEEHSLFSSGREGEVTREEIRFSKFVARLRSKFSNLFTKILGQQLVLKRLMSIEEWDLISESIQYTYARDNHYEEMKDMAILQQRLTLMQLVEPYIGRFYSNKWAMKNILRMDEEQAEEMREQIIEEIQDPLFAPVEQMVPPSGGAPGAAPSGGGGKGPPKQKSKPKGKSK